MEQAPLAAEPVRRWRSTSSRDTSWSLMVRLIVFLWFHNAKSKVQYFSFQQLTTQRLFNSGITFKTSSRTPMRYMAWAFTHARPIVARVGACSFCHVPCVCFICSRLRRKNKFKAWCLIIMDGVCVLSLTINHSRTIYCEINKYICCDNLATSQTVVELSETAGVTAWPQA